jgi:molybdopterin converting factor small subunit
MARELGGADVVSVDVPDRGVVADVRRALADACPKLAGMATHVLIAVDAEYADDGTPVTAQSEVALIPPVSGG